MTSANSSAENLSRIEPTRLDEASETIADLIAELSAAGAVLGARLHPTTAANLAAPIRIMNTYYSNLIEGHDTRPRDIEQALIGHFEQDENRRHLQLRPGSYMKHPAGAAHYDGSIDEEVIVEIKGMGPAPLIYVDSDGNPIE